MTDEEIENLLKALHWPSHEKDMSVKARRLEDGYVELLFTDHDDPDLEIAADVRFAGKFNESNMLEVRQFDHRDNTTRRFYVSAIGYVLFGAVYCEP